MKHNFKKNDDFSLIDPATKNVYEGKILSVLDNGYLVLLKEHKFSIELTFDILKGWVKNKKVKS